MTCVGSDPTGPVSAGLIKISGFLCPNASATSPALKDYSGKMTKYDTYEAYDYSLGEDDVPSHQNSYLLVLTYRTPPLPSSANTRGLIIQPTRESADEYRRVGSFCLNSADRPEFAGLDMSNLARQMVTII